MKKLITLLSFISLGVLTSSCVSSISNSEEREYQVYKKKNLEVKAKNEYIGVGLGILPGGGSFYTGHYVVGVLDLLAWPLSVLWDPINGYNGAIKVNYEKTKEYVQTHKEMEIRDLTKGLESGNLDERRYFIEKQKIEDKYSSIF